MEALIKGFEHLALLSSHLGNEGFKNRFYFPCGYKQKKVSS